MLKFSEFKIADSFFSTCIISEKELEAYLKFSRVKNAFLDDKQKGEHPMNIQIESLEKARELILSVIEKETLAQQSLVEQTEELEPEVIHAALQIQYMNEDARNYAIASIQIIKSASGR